MKWEILNFKEFVTLQRGFDLTKKQIIEGPFPVIGSSGIVGYHNEFKNTGPGIIVGRSGSIGTIRYTQDNYWAHNTSLWVKDFKGNIPKFIYYLFHTINFTKYNSGGAVPSLNRNLLDNLKVNVPPLPIQKKIASILSAYDDLIENNLRRIELLEKAARELYKEWFVRFKFPGHEKAKFKDGLPEGWEQIRYKDILNFTTGKLNSNAAKTNGQYPFFTCAQEIYKTDTYTFDCEAVLLGGNNANAIYPVFYFNGKFDAYQRTYIISPLPHIYLPIKYIYFLIKENLANLKSISIGVATKYLTLTILNEIKTILPNKENLVLFDKIVAPIFKQLSILKQQNQLLKQARDLLLPRLMKGEIEV